LYDEGNSAITLKEASGGVGSDVEVDETFIAGKAGNMHRSRGARVITGTGGKDKTVVMGMMEHG
jgi:hypothetical protein